jgi:hypothetical protein
MGGSFTPEYAIRGSYSGNPEKVKKNFEFCGFPECYHLSDSKAVVEYG